ncbi:hypothetical protein DPQ22_00235 [Candidatus Tokpelaia sp.]|nr:hypothetical protein DPQ22_00235 [Candidatus Tokpelaia sp.]
MLNRPGQAQYNLTLAAIAYMQGSRLKAQGSRLKAQGSRLKAQGSRLSPEQARAGCIIENRRRAR